MIYNCMEYGARESLIGLRQDIASSGYSYDRLKSYWQEDIVHAHFHDRLQQGCNNAQLVRDFSAFDPGVVAWHPAIDRLPFPGNVRSEERRVGKGCVSKCSSRWWQYN